MSRSSTLFDKCSKMTQGGEQMTEWQLSGRFSYWRLVALASVVALLAVWTSVGEASHLKGSPKKHRIVYQLDDAGVDQAKFVLRNIRNHVVGVGGWRNIEALELVVFGPALKSFVLQTMDPDLKRALDSLQTEGMAFGVCG